MDITEDKKQKSVQGLRSLLDVCLSIITVAVQLLSSLPPNFSTAVDPSVVFGEMSVDLR